MGIKTTTFEKKHRELAVARTFKRRFGVDIYVDTRGWDYLLNLAPNSDLSNRIPTPEPFEKESERRARNRKIYDPMGNQLVPHVEDHYYTPSYRLFLETIPQSYFPRDIEGLDDDCLVYYDITTGDILNVLWRTDAEGVPNPDLYQAQRFFDWYYDPYAEIQTVRRVSGKEMKEKNQSEPLILLDIYDDPIRWLPGEEMIAFIGKIKVEEGMSVHEKKSKFVPLINGRPRLDQVRVRNITARMSTIK